MTSSTHILAWAAVDNSGEIDLETICTRKSSAETYPHRSPDVYKTAVPITIILGHELADQSEKEK